MVGFRVGVEIKRWTLSVLLAGTVCLSTASSATDISTLPLIQGARGKVVLLDFWASWCAPCRKSFPWMNALQQKYGNQGLRVIAVNLDMDKQLAAEFLHAVPAAFRIEYDPSGNLATQLNVSAMPTSFVLDRQGRIVKQHAGFREAQLAARVAEIETLLKE
ncbi:MAG: TlpA disulfide reductase family protein [Steroidobacteraceae bacterium]